MNKTFYITTTLPYVNAPLHMGHALEFVRADTIARYKKLQGFDVYFNTGTDEHGIKIYEKAIENGVEVQKFVDQGFETFKKQLQMFGVLEEIHYIRTTDENHIKAVETFWKKVRDNSYIYKKQYEAKYCIGCESEKTDSELVEGKCPMHPDVELKLISEENYFFKYSAFGDKLLKFYEENSNFVVPDFRLNEIKNFVKGGLQDFSISRLKEKMPWGILVPGDDTQVIYVWFDALINYISTLGWGSGGEESNFQKYWVNGNPTQYCGKDNTRFQAAMWQAMLMAAEVPNSHQIIVNGFITAEGGVRMSKSLGNGVDPSLIVSEYGTDALRYFLLREVGSFEDSPFTLERFKDAYNSGLANGLGNLVSRVMKMAISNNIKYDVTKFIIDEKGLSIEDEMIINYRENIEKFNISNATANIWHIIKLCDQKIQSNEPFKKIKNEETKTEAINIIQFLLHDIKQIGILLKPIMPETANKILDLIKENKMPEAPLFLRKD